MGHTSCLFLSNKLICYTLYSVTLDKQWLIPLLYNNMSCIMFCLSLKLHGIKNWKPHLILRLRIPLFNLEFPWFHAPLWLCLVFAMGSDNAHPNFTVLFVHRKATLPPNSTRPGSGTGLYCQTVLRSTRAATPRYYLVPWRHSHRARGQTTGQYDLPLQHLSASERLQAIYVCSPAIQGLQYCKAEIPLYELSCLMMSPALSWTPASVGVPTSHWAYTPLKLACNQGTHEGAVKTYGNITELILCDCHGVRLKSAGDISLCCGNGHVKILSHV